MKFFFVDCETTGTDTRKHGLIQIAGKIVIDNVTERVFNFNAAPMEGDIIDPESLTVTGLTEEQIRAYPDPRGTFLSFRNMLGQHVDKFKRTDKFHFVGFNSQFDADMIRSWFLKNDDEFFGSWFFWPTIDVAQLAAVELMEKRHRMPNFKLATVATWMGIEFDEEKAHDASYDIDVTEQIFHLCMRKHIQPSQSPLNAPMKEY